jgi:hypothetical protein
MHSFLIEKSDLDFIENKSLKIDRYRYILKESH